VGQGGWGWSILFFSSTSKLTALLACLLACLSLIPSFEQSTEALAFINKTMAKQALFHIN
jgi:hypothetical protein